MNKFKVGEKYTISNKSMKRNRNVIEITSIKETNHSARYYYKTIIGDDKNDGWWFDENSIFSNSLVPVKPDRYELHITCVDGTTTNAVYKVNGKVEKTAKAVCCPTDTFDFNIGAELAMKRVFGIEDKPFVPEDSSGTVCAKEPAQTKQEDKPKFKVGDKVKVIDRRSCHGFEMGKIITLRSLDDKRNCENPYSLAWMAEESNFCYIRECDIEPYAEPSAFDNMSNEALKKALCEISNRCCPDIGDCNRKSDCPFYCKASCVVTDENRAEIIRYLVSENVTIEESSAPSLIVTSDMLGKLNACAGGRNAFETHFPNGGELETVIATARRIGRSGDAAWLDSRRDRIVAMQNQPTKEKEAVTLYCISDAWGVRRGEQYFIDKNGMFTDKDGTSSGPYKSLEDFKKRNPTFSLNFIEAVKRPAVVGEWVLITNGRPVGEYGGYENGKIYKVVKQDSNNAFICGVPKEYKTASYGEGTSIVSHAEYLVLDGYKPEPEKVEPVNPYLLCGKTHYGIIGTPTKYKDVVSRPLFVGDTVELFGNDGNLRGERVIVISETFHGNQKCFVFGIEAHCDENLGTTGSWKIIKKKSYSDIKRGEVVDGIEYKDEQL